MQRLLFLLAIILMFSSCKNSAVYGDRPLFYHTGDNSLWAAPSYPDKDWRGERGNTGDKLFWVRSQVRLLKTPDGPLGLQLEAFGAFEVYWDGVLIGRNGRIPQRGVPEVPGTESSYFRVPDTLSGTGMHVLALRASQSYQGKLQRGIGIRLDNYERLLRGPLIIMSFMNLMAGAFLIAAVYYFFLYANSRLREYAILIFAVICLLFFMLLVMEYIKFYMRIPYTQFFIRLEIIGWLTFAIAVLVPLYFTIQFNFKRKILLLSLLLVVLAAIYGLNYGHYDITAIYYSIAMWLASVVVVITSIFQKEKGGIIVLAGLLASVVIDNFLVYDFSLFISFTLIVLCMLYLHTIRARVIEEEYQSSLLLSSRLKLELIKKNIQPHFLRNTLTSLIDWVEESPKQGVEFIQALAGEFDIMNAIAEAALIPVRQEIDLCKTHLSVMQFRKEVHYEWEESGIDEAEQLPPAVIHTILENGITHSIPSVDGNIFFHLHFERFKGGKQYSFETRAENRPERKGRQEGVMQQERKNKNKNEDKLAGEVKQGGNGFRYIRARLTESYGDRWEFMSEAVPQGWMTTIKLYDK